MNPSTLDIERVVRQVLAELGLAPNGDAASSKQAHTEVGRSNEGAAESGESSELVLTGRVITLAEVDGRLDGVCRLTVAGRAVVTPAVRDELGQRGIRLTFAAAADEKLSAGNGIKLMVATVGSSFDVTRLSELLRSDGIEVTPERHDCLIRATDELGRRLSRPDTLGLLVTKQTAAGLCLANRRAGVRAVLGFDATTAASDIAAVGANLLIADPAAIGPFGLKQIASQFCRGGPAVCPAVFGDRLG